MLCENYKHFGETTTNLARSFAYVELSRQAIRQFVDINAHYLSYVQCKREARTNLGTIVYNSDLTTDM